MSRAVPGSDEKGWQRLTFFHPRQGAEELDIPERAGGHGGSDPALRADFFGRSWDEERPDEMATLDEAIQAVLIGAAANESIANGGNPVLVQSLLG